MFKRFQIVSLYFCWMLLIFVITFPAPKSLSAQNQSVALPFSLPIDKSKLPTGAIIDTTKGQFEISFYVKQAALTVRNFQYLAEKKFYDGLTFHKHEPNFIVQGGDPLGTGKGGPGYTLSAEFSELKHTRGAVAMARLPSEVNPERRSNGSQFYITLSEAKHLDGLYTVFAHVVWGMDTVDKIMPGDKILSIRIIRD